MLFDSLKSAGKTGEYTKQEGRITSAGNFAEAFAGVAGGLLAAFSLRFPFYFQFAVAAIAIPASLTLIEPKFRTGEHIHSIKQFLVNLGGLLKYNHNLRISMLLSAITGTATLTFAWLVQPFFIEIKLPVEWYGIFWTALNLTVGISSAVAHSFEERLGKSWIFPAIILSVAAGFLLTGISVSWWGLSFLFLFYLIRGIATPVLKSNINQFTTSEVRATILSVRDFLIRLIFAAIGPFLGWTTDNIGLNLAFIIAGAFYLVVAFIIIIPWIKRETKFINNKY
jgi:hypothetical protein